MKAHQMTYIFFWFEAYKLCI